MKNYTLMVLFIILLFFITSCSSVQEISTDNYIWSYNIKAKSYTTGIYKVSNDSAYIFIYCHYDKTVFKIILDLNTGKELKFREVPSPSFNDFEMTYYKVFKDTMLYNDNYLLYYLKTPNNFKYSLVYAIAINSDRFLGVLFPSKDLIRITKRNTDKEYIYKFKYRILDLNFYKDKYLIIAYTKNIKDGVSVSMIDLDKLIGEEE